MNSIRPLIAGNWKMFKTCREAADTMRELLKLCREAPSDLDIMVAPPFTSLATVADIIKDSRIALGAQNVFWKSEGAYTGEISPPMLVASGCRYVIIGHSERRQYFHETDEAINRKIKAAVNHDLIPIFCIGETERQRESGETFSVLDKQVQKGLEGLSSDDLLHAVIAYEPIWAIGTGKTATSETAQEVHHHIRSWIEKRFGSRLAKSIRILYGGSVKPNNIKELMSMNDINGALVGGASLDASTFFDIISYDN